MTEKNQSSERSSGELMLDFFDIFSKRKNFFVYFVGGITILSIVVALILPKWYKASASVLPAENTDLLGMLGGASSLVKSLSFGSKLSSLTGNNEIDRYLAILKSERALTAVIDKFDLATEYDITKYIREKTIKELLSNVDFEQTDEGALTITVYDKNPEQAAQMANYFVVLLNDINSEMKAQNAKANRVFIEQRYNKNIADIDSAQAAMRHFQEKNGVVAIPEQLEASIKAGAEITAQLSLKEIELSVLRRTLSETHPNVVAKEIEVQELRKKIDEMNSRSMFSNNMNILLPFKKAPELAEKYLKYYRDLKIQEKILEFMAPLYEQAKVEEKRETPSVIVLDRASVPERKAKPKISLYALLAFVASSLVGLFIVFLLEGKDKIKLLYPERYSLIRNSLRTGWFKK